MSKKPRKTVNPHHDFIVQTLEKLVKPEFLEKTGWGREYKIFKKLLDEYPDKRIWSNIEFQVKSLIWYLGKDGKDYLKKIQNKIDFELKPVIIIPIEENKIGEDSVVSKPISIKDFLKQYGK